MEIEAEVNAEMARIEADIADAERKALEEAGLAEADPEAQPEPESNPNSSFNKTDTWNNG